MIEYNNPQRKRRLVGIYIFMGILFVGLMVVFVLMVTGKKFELNKGEVKVVELAKIKVDLSGLDNIGSTIKVNNQEITSFAFTGNKQMNVRDGNYLIDITRDKYLPWKKNLRVSTKEERGKMYWLHARLIPSQKRIQTVRTYDNLLAGFSTPFSRYMMAELAPNQFQMIDTRDDTPTYADINLANYLGLDKKTSLDRQPVAPIGDEEFKYFAANPFVSDFKQVIFKDIKSPNGRVIVVNPDQPRATFDLSTIFKADDGTPIAIDDILFVDDKNYYVRSGTKLYRFNTTNRKTAPPLIFEDVIDVQVIGGSVLAVLHAAPDKADYSARVAIYNYMAARNESSEVEVDRIPEGQPALIAAGQYGNDLKDSYLAYSSGGRVRVIRGDLQNLAKADPLTDASPVAPKPDEDVESEVLKAFKKQKIKIVSSKFYDRPIENIAMGKKNRYVFLDFGAKQVSVESEKELEANAQKTDESTEQTSGGNVTKNPESHIDQKNLVSVLSDVESLDLEHLERYNFEYSLVSGSRSLTDPRRKLHWLDSFMLWENVGGSLRVKDYDGQNQRKLVQALPNFDIQLTNSGKYIYYFSKSDDGKFLLRRLYMTGF